MQNSNRCPNKPSESTDGALIRQGVRPDAVPARPPPAGSREAVNRRHKKTPAVTAVLRQFAHRKRLDSAVFYDCPRANVTRTAFSAYNLSRGTTTGPLASAIPLLPFFLFLIIYIS